MNKGLKVVFSIFSLLFFIVISSLVYFLVFKSEYYANHELNRRVYEERNKYIRGNILDRNGEVLSYTQKEDKTQKRIYNYGEVFLHPLGYFHDRYGMSGIENYMDEYLREPQGILSRVKNFFTSKEEIHGNDIKLTLNKDIQLYAYDILGNNKGAIVVMNPNTGEIYSLVSKPSFNPNYINETWENVANDKNAPLYNRALNGKYPPGSTFKVITLVSAIENLKGVLSRKFKDDGFISFNENERLYNQNQKAYGEITLKDAFVKSSNVVFGNLSLEMGNSLLKDYAGKFYFNHDLYLEGGNVSKSYFPTLNKNEVGLIAQSGIGQGSILSTPLQMCMVSSSVANGGVLKRPYMVSEILNNENYILKKNKPRTLHRVMKKTTSNVLKEYMREVVTTNLSHISELNEINAAGKTGTADYKKYGVDGTPHSWFIGFAPYDNPKVSIAVIVEEGGDGSKIASELSGKIMKKSLEVLK